MAKRKDDFDELIQGAKAAVEKKFKDSTVGLGSEKLIYPTQWVSTGSLSLDRLCRGFNPGGLPVGPGQGRVVHVAGDWSTGKSAILDHLCKSIQDMGGISAITETEMSRDPHFAQAIGLDLSRVVIFNPPTIEESFAEFEVWHDYVRSKNAEIPIIHGYDSLTATEAQRTADSQLTESGLFSYGGGRSQALGDALRRYVNRICGRYPTTLVMLNQTRDKIGVMFGDKKTTPGGNPPHFYASLEIRLSIGSKGDVRGPYQGAKLSAEQRKRFGLRATERGNIIGRWIRARVTKSKVGENLGQDCDFYISFERGINKGSGLLQRLLEEGAVTLGKNNAILHGDLSFAEEAAWLKHVAQNMDLLDKRQAEKPTEKSDGKASGRDSSRIQRNEEGQKP